MLHKINTDSGREEEELICLKIRGKETLQRNVSLTQLLTLFLKKEVEIILQQHNCMSKADTIKIDK